MAHMVETMAYAGETPWHGLGVKVPSDLSPAQMLEKAGLDWTVQKIPAFANIDGQQTNVGWSALVRSSDKEVLSVVSNDWNPVQNHDAFEFFHEYCAAGDMEMDTAGSLRDGQIVWGLAKIKESFELFKGDRVDSYLLFTNPHKFGQSIDVRFTPIRVVCNNTLTLSLSQQVERVVKYKEMAQFLGSKRYTTENLTEYFNRVFPVLAYNKEKGPQRKTLSKSATRALEIIGTQPGANFAEGSWWQAFNAVTFMTDHEIGRTADSRLTSAWFGPNKNLKVKALETAVEFAELA